jgi:hypothetical protein
MNGRSGRVVGDRKLAAGVAAGDGPSDSWREIPFAPAEARANPLVDLGLAVSRATRRIPTQFYRFAGAATAQIGLFMNRTMFPRRYSVLKAFVGEIDAARVAGTMTAKKCADRERTGGLGRRIDQAQLRLV